jgi:hypothetical protein
MIQFNIYCILHACFHNFIILSLITHIYKIEFTVIKMAFHVSCKHTCFDIQNNCAMRKTIITSILVSFTHLYRTPPPKSLIKAQQSRNMRKPNISLKLELKHVLSPKQLKIGFLSFCQSFGQEDRTFGLDIVHLSSKG